MGISLADLQTKSKALASKSKYDFSRYTWQGKEIITPHRNNVKYLADSILAMNERVSYVSVLMSGQSGSGKSSAITTLIHRMSCNQKDPYVVKWFSGKDLHDLDTIIDNLKSGLKHILIFDDVSFQMELTGSAIHKKRLANALTTIRHKVGGKVICFFSIHFMTSLIPMMRDSSFRILTSMSDQDRSNWENVFSKTSRWKLEKFQKMYASQMQKGYFYLNNNVEDKQNNYFQVDKPYRVTLVSEISGLRNVLFPLEQCNLCKQPKTKIKKKISATAFYEDIMKAYTIRGKTALGYFAYYRLGKSDIMPVQSVRALKYITNMVSKYDVDFDELAEIISKNAKTKRKKIHKTDKALEREQELIKKSNITPESMSIFD